jgi:hypothetical protein
VVTEDEQLVAAVARDDRADERVVGGGGQEDVEGGLQGGLRIVEVRVDRPLDRGEEAIGLAQDVGLRELLARAELLVERLAAHAGGRRDLGHRHLGPRARAQLLAHRVEQRRAQQLARGDRVGRQCIVGHRLQHKGAWPFTFGRSGG